jgi:hypothetical protein
MDNKLDNFEKLKSVLRGDGIITSTLWHTNAVKLHTEEKNKCFKNFGWNAFGCETNYGTKTISLIQF